MLYQLRGLLRQLEILRTERYKSLSTNQPKPKAKYFKLSLTKKIKNASNPKHRYSWLAEQETIFLHHRDFIPVFLVKVASEILVGNTAYFKYGDTAQYTKV